MQVGNPDISLNDLVMFKDGASLGQRNSTKVPKHSASVGKKDSFTNNLAAGDEELDGIQVLMPELARIRKNLTTAGQTNERQLIGTPGDPSGRLSHHYLSLNKLPTTNPKKRRNI